jgi:hypothetical protein
MWEADEALAVPGDHYQTKYNYLVVPTNFGNLFDPGD